jgi:nucleoside-diphosphate-sugar epimerase
MKSARDVCRADLEHIGTGLQREWPLLAGRKVLITGGAGFLGHYMVQGLTHFNQNASRGDQIAVTVWDNFSRGLPAWLGALREAGAVTLRKYDLRWPLPEDMGTFDYILHGASIASPTFYRRHPIETMDGNVNGLRNLLDHALRQARTGQPLQGLLFWSSSEIYGDPDAAQIPTPEDYRGNVSCTGPRACYDESKRYGETLCTVFAKQHGLPIRVARPFNNYGPGLKINDGRVIPDFCRAILAGEDIVMLSDGSPQRTFCYAADAVVGYYKVLTRGGPAEPYNIGIETPEISMLELAEKLAAIARELFAYGGKIVTRASADEDYLVDNPNRRCPVIAKARRELGFDPSVSLDDGLRRVLIWYSENRDVPEEAWTPEEAPTR